MPASVSTLTVSAMQLAAVRRRVAAGGIGAAWKPALDQVWEFLRAHPGLRTDGHNVFVYHHPADRISPMDVDFGVAVARGFEAEGDVRPVETPAGEVAMAIHTGPYDRMRETHGDIEAWRAANGRSFAGVAWEIYGDPSSDPAKNMVTILYLLA